MIPRAAGLMRRACKGKRRPFGSYAPKAGAAYNDSVASGSSALYLESLYCQWKANPSSLSGAWQAYFQQLEEGMSPERMPAAGHQLRNEALDAKLSMQAQANGSAASLPTVTNTDAPGISNLVLSYQRRGHEVASLDPLNIHLWRKSGERPPELSYEFHGFTEQDLDRPLRLGGSMGYTPGFLAELVSSGKDVTLRGVLGHLERIYAGHLGVEYMHIMNVKVQNWIRNRIEDPEFGKTDKEVLMRHFTRLVAANEFELFAGKKFKTTKRFGLDGCESMIPGILALVDVAADQGVEQIVVGMAHRGRLNLIGNVLQKPFEQLLSEFQDTHYDVHKVMTELETEDWSSTGDVKYHLGTSNVATTANGKKVRLTLEANPSHLETVDPIALGRTRAKQFYGNIESRNQGVEEETVKNFSKVLPVQFHGDAAFAGQGIVYETMQLQKVKKFNVGGTVHVVLNNQVGFTTDPWESRSTLYCSDIGKAFSAPVFHCNADDLQSVVQAFELASAFRMEFQQDVIIDMVCIRRFGHNEIDNPDFTQPVLYKHIRAHPTTEQVMAKKYVDVLKVCTQEEIDAIRKAAQDNMANALEKSKSWIPKDVGTEWVPTHWAGFEKPTGKVRLPYTGVEADELKEVGSKISAIPEDFNAHNIVKKTYQARQASLECGKGIDWGFAEALAFGTLLRDGYHVRLTGQDVGRGTFSHRHAMLTDQKDGTNKYVPLNNISPNRHSYNAALDRTLKDGLEPWDKKRDQASMTVQNSILSEYGVLGFELGYSYENPFSLCIWEAQFGDFCNTAQVIIDQFVAAAEHKWLQRSGLVMLLPHGYDGQGSEHSSCRLERFLQLADDDEDDARSMVCQRDDPMLCVVPQQMRTNMCIVNVSTPANYFHVLRRQCKREFRKPLIVVAPKKLLRLPAAKSDLDSFEGKKRFQRLIDERDASIKPEEVTRLIFCSGQIYYDLVAERERLGMKNVAIVTVEEIAPFPYDRANEIFQKYPNVDHGDGVHPGQVVWCQEEPKNNGAWSYVKPRLVTTAREGVQKDMVVRYCGRRAAASPATGFAKLHFAEHKAVVETALLGHDDSLGPRASALLGHTT